MISCVMPTADRHQFLPLAYRCFQQQTYPNRELVILDNGVDRCGRIVAGWADPRVRYYQCSSEPSMGALRNMVVDLANGPLIANWDDDDYSAPERLAFQELLLKGHEVSGFNEMYFVDQRRASPVVWAYHAGDDHYAVGTSLMFAKDLWRARGFDEVKGDRFPIKERGEPVDVGEDNAFIDGRDVATASTLKTLIMVARIHPGGTARQINAGPQWIVQESPALIAKVKACLSSPVSAARR